ncbi:MAG: vWA domain-containing protein [Gemmatimonadota bacterium]
MGFLNPLWLLLGTAIAVPLIIHLLQRHQGPRVIFPAVRYLKRAEREHARRIRLRQLLLLLLRITVLLLIAFAAARPFVRGAGVGHAPTAVAIVLDNSLSSGLVTGDRRLLDELKDRALETLGRAGPDDRFWLLRAGAPWEPALPGDAQTIAARVRETEPTAAAADIIGALTRARALLGQGAEGRAREIQLLSDLQQSNLRGSLAANPNDEVDIVLWQPQRRSEPNASVEAVTVGGGLAPRAGERSTVVAAIGGNARDSLNVRLSLDGRIAAAAIALPGSEAVMPLPARNAGLVTGEVEIDADALRADDRKHFVVMITPAPTVTLTRATPFVAQALSVLADAKRVTRTTSSATADVVIAPAAIGAAAVGATGSVVVLAPETPLELPAVNRRLAALGINWRYEQSSAAGELRFAHAGSTDELLRGLAAARVSQQYRLTPTGRSPQDSIMLRLEDGSAWAVRGARARGGRFVLIASALTTDATTLPATAAMVPLIDRLTGPWSTADAPRSEVLPGQLVAMPRNADTVIDPDGVRHTVVGGENFSDATTPGIYRVAANGTIVGAFVVNPARTESVLQYADARRVERALASLNVKRATSPNDWAKRIFDSRIGHEFWRVVLLMLLALMLIEAFAAATAPARAS